MPAPRGKKQDKKTKVEEAKLVVFGTGGVGKSALIVQLIQSQFVEQYDPTLEDSYRKDTNLDGKDIIMDILDTAGQEEFHSLRDQYIRQGEGYLIIYSINNRSSFEEVETFLDQILSAKEITEDLIAEAAQECAVVLVGNKCDLVDQRKVTREEGEQLAKKYGGISFYESSAKTRVNVEEAFHDCARQVFQKVKNKNGKKKCRMM